MEKYVSPSAEIFTIDVESPLLTDSYTFNVPDGSNNGNDNEWI